MRGPAAAIGGTFATRLGSDIGDGADAPRMRARRLAVMAWRVAASICARRHLQVIGPRPTRLHRAHIRRHSGLRQCLTNGRGPTLAGLQFRGSAACLR
mmetsp:Transcript_56266/g.156727  ORF Transcript_56266/g.156727 Transcript_56266/m.156727 type:complete len:98 (+) Transcript_56266:2055-2348(+)